MNETQLENRRQLRRRLGRIAWAVLLFLVVGQTLGALSQGLPGLAYYPNAALVAGYVCSYGLAPVAMWLVLRKLPKGSCPNLPLTPKALGRTAVYCVGVLYIFNLLTTLVMMLVELVSGSTTGNLLQSMADSTPTWLYVVLAGFIAPVCEELIFRKLLLDRARPFGDRAAILISGLAFGLFHLNLYQLFYATALGMVLAGVVLKTGKIWHCMVLHACVNLTATALSGLSTSGETGSMVSLVIILVFCALAVWIFVRYGRTYRFDPPQYPVTNREVLRAAPRSVGVWVCVTLCLLVSVLIVFLV